MSAFVASRSGLPRKTDAAGRALQARGSAKASQKGNNPMAGSDPRSLWRFQRLLSKSMVRCGANAARPEPVQAPSKLPASPPLRPTAHGTLRHDRDDPPIRLAHVLFVLWVAGSVGWALYAAQLARGLGRWVEAPELGAILVLALPAIAHILAIHIIKMTGNPRFR